MEQLGMLKANEELTYIFCHYCQKLKNLNEIITCSNEDCKESFCSDCIKNIFKINESFKELINESNENGWICFICNDLCDCQKCLNKEKNQNDNNVKNIKKNYFNKKFEVEKPRIITKESGKDALLMDTLYNNFKHFQNKNTIKNKQISKVENKLIKVARGCEHFYRHKCSKNFIFKKCIICGKKEHHTNELVRFITTKQFISYQKYLYICMENILSYNKNIFHKNKIEFLDYYKKYEEGLINWNFKNPKIICKYCIIDILNKPNATNFFQNNFKDSFDNIYNLSNEKIKNDKSINNILNEKIFLEMKDYYQKFFLSIYELIFIAKCININSEMNNIIYLRNEMILINEKINYNYDILKKFLEKYLHLVNELMNYIYSLIEKDHQIINNFIVSNIEIKQLQECFFLHFENFKMIIQKYIHILNEYIKKNY